MGGRFGGTENGNADFLKMVYDAGGQRSFRPDDGQVNSIFPTEFSQPFDIIGLNVQVLGNFSRAGITRGGINLFCPGALGNFPDQSVLPSATADNKDFQGLPPLVLLRDHSAKYSLHRVIARPSAESGGEAIWVGSL